MEIPVLIVMGAALAGGAAFFWRQILERKWLGKTGFTQKPFMTPNEVEFFGRLQKGLPAGWLALPQVSMGAIVETKLLPTNPRYWDARAQFQGKICDFVICDSESLRPVLVIELDDVMHDFDKDKLRDIVVAKAGYRTLRFWSRKKPTVSELRDILSRNLALARRPT